MLYVFCHQLSPGGLTFSGEAVELQWTYGLSATSSVLFSGPPVPGEVGTYCEWMT